MASTPRALRPRGVGVPGAGIPLRMNWQAFVLGGLVVAVLILLVTVF